MESTEDNCAICIGELKKGLTCNLDCNHTFHYDCIKSVKNTKCPLCRTDFYMHHVYKTKYEYYNHISNMIDVLYFNLADEHNDHEFNEKMDKRSVKFIVKEKLNEISLMIEFLDLQDSVNGEYHYELDDVLAKQRGGYELLDMFNFIKNLFDEFIDNEECVPDYESLTDLETTMYDRGLLYLVKYIKDYNYTL